MKTNINRPFLKREDIMNRSNFKDVLLKSGGVRNPFFKSTKWIAGLGIAASVILVVYFYESGKSKPFINPPLAGVNIPVTDYAVNPLQDTTLVYSTGSSISIPANTFMDSKGNLVSGKVNVHYREFHDAVEFFASGIPMSYDSGGVSYTFQSAGMMEIEAYQNGERLSMNPEKRINVSLASTQKEDKFNLYVLDTVSKQWVYKGRSNPVAAQTAINDTSIPGPVGDSLAAPSLAELKAKEIKRLEASKPMEPKKATKDNYRFTLEVDSNEFPEIAVYKNLMFEVGAENTNFDPKTDETTWENVKLKENRKGMNYTISLSTKDRAVSYVVYPVFEGKNYDAAMAQYKIKYSEYERKLETKKFEEERLLAEAKRREAFLKVEQDKQDRIDQANERRMVEANNQLVAALQRDQAEAAIMAGVNYGTVRQQFAISGFGIWNSDYPFKFESPTIIQASFKDKSGRELRVQQAFLIDKKKNILFAHYVPYSSVQFDPESENILFAVLPDQRIAVFSAKQFREMGVSGGNYTFIMDVTDKRYHTVKEVAAMLGV